MLEPRFSIITPVLDPRAGLLQAMLSSVCGQTFEDWELCLCDVGLCQPQVRAILDRAAEEDSRIRVRRRDADGGSAAASTDALAMARADFVALLGHTDELHRSALALIDEAIRATPGTDFLYSDEDVIDAAGHRSSVFFKPDWSQERIRAQNYTGGLSVLRRSLVEAVGGFDTDLEGVEAWDLTLRASERATTILHVPKVLYHRRATDDAASDPDSEGRRSAAETGRKAVQAHCRRIGLLARVEADVTRPGICHLRPALGSRPTVSIVIPTNGQSRSIRGDEPTILALHCVRSIVSTSTYDAYEIVCVVDASTKRSLLDELRAVAGERLRLVRFEGQFNFSAKVNLGVDRSDGEHLLLLNDDMEVVTPDWIERMVMYSDHSGVGVVGAQLRWEDGRVQHAGVVFEKGLPGHVFRGAGRELKGYEENVLVPQNYLAVTGACLMTPRSAFEEVGGFSTELPVNYNDMDYCLKQRARGRRIVYDADTILYHFESSSRSSKVRKWETALFLDKWLSTIRIDPFSNPNLRYGRPRSRLDCLREHVGRLRRAW